jgi:hypothetical protein
MAESTRETKTHPAEPPAGGHQDHDAMRAASMRPVSGPAATDRLAASGGLNVPGNDPTAAAQIDVPTADPVNEPIPGERDASTLMHRQPGSMGSAFGAGMPQPSSTMDEQTLHDRLLEGGGQAHQHHRADESKTRER